jgi:hypothetical protein
LSPASGAAAAEPSLARTIQREAGRNVGPVPGPVLEKSAELPAHPIALAVLSQPQAGHSTQPH